jgi:YD repeat-containing protein
MSTVGDPPVEGERLAVVEVDDPTRGRRVVRFAPDGTPVRIERADGSVLDIERDDRRRALVLGTGGRALVTLRAERGQVTAVDPSGSTTAWRTQRGTRVERRDGEGGARPGGPDRPGGTGGTGGPGGPGGPGGAVLRIDRDAAGRPRRVTLPGSESDLHYRWVSPGRWSVETSSAEVVLTLRSGPGGTTSVDLPGGWGWDEELAESTVTCTATDGVALATTELDAAGRVAGRTTADGARHRYARDDRGRVVVWSTSRADGSATSTRWEFEGASIAATVRDGRRRRHRVDAGERVTALLGGGRPTVRHRFDANGARTARIGPDGTTTYTYDVLGQLTGMTRPDGTRTTIGWDGLGRRVQVVADGIRLDEHRDLDGRLWAVTDAEGRAVHTFVWWEGRVVARLDGPVGAGVAEAYVTDPYGTLAAAVTVGARGEPARVEPASGHPYGDAGGRYRPSLFGHVTDGVTGLIPFGARDFDPESISFLTPDPWHEGADDPRRVAGARTERLMAQAESPRDGVHPYALAQFDPLSRPDLDGHVAAGNILLTILLAPTWGFPLTSLSLFFFFPLNLYMELVGLIVMLFTWGDHPWPQHSLGNLRGLAGSSRLGTFGIALNGFLPRVISGGGVDADRAVTIGHVPWENRRYFDLLDRPYVLTVQDLSGPPDANGVPSGGPTAFSRTDRGSIVVVEGKDADNRLWIHGSWWTRGGGSHVGIRGGSQVFEDRVAPGTAHSTGSILLAQQLPEPMATPHSEDDDGSLTVTEYQATLTSTGEIVSEQWFAITVEDDSGLAAGTAVRVQADDDDVKPAYAGIQTVLDTAGDPIVVLDAALPPRFHTAELKEDLRLDRLSAATGAAEGSSVGWAAADPARRGLTHASPGHRVRAGDVVSVTPTPAAPGPQRPVVFGEVESVRLTVTPSVALPAAQVDAVVTVLAPDGTAVAGNVADPVGAPSEVAITGATTLAVDDLVLVQPPGGRPHHARITAVAAGTPTVLTVDPPVPASVAGAANTAVNVARVRPGTEARDTAKVLADTPAVVFEVSSSDVVPAGTGVRITKGASTVVRTVEAVTATALVLRDEMVPATAPAIGPDFAVVVQSVGDDDIDGEIAAERFIRRTGGDQPSAYGTWPEQVMGLVPTAYSTGRAPRGYRFFVNPTVPIADIHPDFHATWKPLTLGSEQFWLLGSPVKVHANGSRNDWEPDPDDTYPRRHRQDLGAAPWTVTVRAFARAATPVVRPLPGGAKVLCREAETQVPDEPTVRWSLGDALDEHELAHTLQNTYWGPLLGALPLQGLFRTVPDTFAAAGSERPEWMDWNPFDEAGGGVGFDDTNVFELLSMAGLMQLVWTFVILGPVLANDSARHFLLTKDFADWGRIFNPVNQLIIDNVPEIDPDAPAGERWGLWFAHLATKAVDMRTWTPLVGLVPLLLPDGATNFLEQQASRWSGDLYSTIVTVNDRSNRDLRLRPGNALVASKREGDQTVSLGTAARVMTYYSLPHDRFLLFDGCDAPTNLTYFQEGNSGGGERNNVQVRLTTAPPGGGPALLVEGHFRRANGAALPNVTVDGPEVPDPANPGGTVRPTVTLSEVATGIAIEPLPRTLVPVAPAVVRTMGFYLVPASEGAWTVAAFEGDAANPEEDPHTEHATVTVAGTVRMGDTTVPWSRPLASGVPGPPPAPATDDVSRFVTEVVPLVVAGQDTSSWKAEGGPGLSLAPIPGGGGWTTTFSRPAGALPVRSRVRIWRPVRADERSLFDFEHVDEPTRAGIRSYVDAGSETWIPVRDFSVEIAPLPVLPNATVAAAEAFELQLAIPVAGPGSIVITPAGGRTVSHTRKGSGPGRGETWELSLDGGEPLAGNLVFGVEVTFGTAPVTETDRFELTITP